MVVVVVVAAAVATVVVFLCICLFGCVVVVVVLLLFFSISFTPCRKFGSLYLNKATAATRAALPIPNSA